MSRNLKASRFHFMDTEEYQCSSSRPKSANSSVVTGSSKASNRTSSSFSSSNSKASRNSSKYSPTTDVLLDCPKRPSTAGYDLRPYGKPSDIGKLFEGYGCKKKAADKPDNCHELPVVFPFHTPHISPTKIEEDHHLNLEYQSTSVPSPTGGRTSPKQAWEEPATIKGIGYGKKSSIGKLFVSYGGKRIEPNRNESHIF